MPSIEHELETLPDGLDWEAFSARLLLAARNTLAHQAVDEQAELTILISDDAALQRLNAEFMGIEAPTDVLSFPADEELDPETNQPYLGDIIISLERAQTQATTGGLSLLDEAQLLVVHGVLHLLGFDHADEDGKAAMWTAQSQVLSGLGVQITPP